MIRSFSHKNYGHFISGQGPIQSVWVIIQAGQGSIQNMVLVILLLLILIIYGLIYIGLFLTFSMAAGLFFIDILLAFSCFIYAEILYFYTQKMG